MSPSSAPLPTPEGPLSVSGAPNLPAGFTDTFTSHYIDTERDVNLVMGAEMRLGSGAFEGAYSYRSRMEDSEPGTNPEELLGALIGRGSANRPSGKFALMEFSQVRVRQDSYSRLYEP
jgi:hypothetical protein